MTRREMVCHVTGEIEDLLKVMRNSNKRRRNRGVDLEVVNDCKKLISTIDHYKKMIQKDPNIPIELLSCTPSFLPELVTGRLYTEGLIDSADEVSSIYICGTGAVMEVLLTKQVKTARKPEKLPCTDRSGIENGSRVRVESYMLRMARQLQDIFSLTLERTDYSGYMGNCPSSCGTYFSITAQRSKLIGSVMHAPRNAFNAPGPVMKLLTTGMIRSCRMFL